MLTACFLSVISRVTQLAPKQGEEQERRADKTEGGKEKRKESVTREVESRANASAGLR